MFEVDINKINNTQIKNNILKSPSEKKTKFNPNNSNSPNIFKHNLKFRLENYNIITKLEEDKFVLE